MRKTLGTVVIVIGILFFGGCFYGIVKMSGNLSEETVSVSDDSILTLKLEGIIFDVDKFLSDLKKYAKKKNVKGILIEVNSPGGAVGPSQALFTEIERVKKELEKPVVVSVTSLAASGGYYAAVAADKIVVTPGSMIGSIGVIINFANLEGLYDWAKIKRYSITTGAYKDSGADYRKMRDDEKQLFQTMIDEVWEQFKNTVKEARNLRPEVIEKYADGRVITGEAAVKIGLADVVGTREDALRLVSKMSGLDGEIKEFTPPKKRKNIFSILEDMESRVKVEGVDTLKSQLKLIGKPLFLMPGVIE